VHYLRQRLLLLRGAGIIVIIMADASTAGIMAVAGYPADLF
jgi:hypothetical protein